MTETRSVSFVDIPSQYRDKAEDIIGFIRGAMDRSAFVGGSALTSFEENLASYTGVKHAIGTSDGTSALILLLKAAGLQENDKVIVPTNSYIASANAVLHAGGRPVFVDCDPETYLLDLNMVEDILKADTIRFLMPVHLYGNPCPMDEILSLSERYGIDVVEDNAQALGASINGKKTGGFGVAAGVSFYPAKNLGAFGQSGAILTNDRAVADLGRTYREQGEGSKRYHHDVVGYNARLHALQAGVLDMLLPKLDSFNAGRAKAAGWYREILPADRLQRPTEESRHVYHLFEYRCDSIEQRSAVAEAFKSANIGFGFHYPVPIHKQKAYRDYNDLSFPVAERLADTLISLPMHPYLSREDVEYVCEVLASTT